MIIIVFVILIDFEKLTVIESLNVKVLIEGGL